MKDDMTSPEDMEEGEAPTFITTLSDITVNENTTVMLEVYFFIGYFFSPFFALKAFSCN